MEKKSYPAQCGGLVSGSFPLKSHELVSYGVEHSAKLMSLRVNKHLQLHLTWQVKQVVQFRGDGIWVDRVECCKVILY